MKKLMLLTIGMALLLTLPAMADQAADEAAIREVFEQMTIAHNNYDAKGVAALTDEVFEVSWDGSQKGRTALEKRYSEMFKRQKDMKYK